MDKSFYEEYHKSGVGTGRMVQAKTVPMNSQKKADFVAGFLKGKVLDVGCGGGFDANFFAKKGFQVEGCDISKAAIDSAKKKFPNMNFFLHNFEQAPLNKSFDCMVCIDVIEHLFYYKEFLANINASLNKGGLLIVSTPNVFGLKSWLRMILKDGTVFGLGTADDSHIRFFSCKTMALALKKAGFKVRQVKTFSQGNLRLPGKWAGSMIAVAEK